MKPIHSLLDIMIISPQNLCPQRYHYIQYVLYQYYENRAVLIGEIIYRSAQRSGVVIGMKTTEVENGETIDGLFKIIDYTHKTGKITPAVVILERKSLQNVFREDSTPNILIK